MLLTAHIREYQPRKIVQYFEVLKEKAPERVIPFDDLRAVGRAYRDINESERAYLVWRGVAEASYLEDARVGEVLRRRGRTLEALAYLISLWREYPNTASIESDFFGLSQVLARLADVALDRPALRRELAEAEVTRSELLLQSIRLIQVFLRSRRTTPWPTRRAWPCRELPGAGGLPRRSSSSSRAVRQALSQEHLPGQLPVQRGPRPFHLGEYDRAIEVAEAIAQATYKDANGVDQPAQQVAGDLHPRPDPRRPPPARPRRRATTGRSPTGSPTRPAPSSR